MTLCIQLRDSERCVKVPLLKSNSSLMLLTTMSHFSKVMSPILTHSLIGPILTPAKKITMLIQQLIGTAL